MLQGILSWQRWSFAFLKSFVYSIVKTISIYMDPGKRLNKLYYACQVSSWPCYFLKKHYAHTHICVFFYLHIPIDWTGNMYANDITVFTNLCCCRPLCFWLIPTVKFYNVVRCQKWSNHCPNVQSAWYLPVFVLFVYLYTGEIHINKHSKCARISQKG